MAEERIFKRKIADEIEKYLGTDNIIVLHGARQVGKTFILKWLKQKLQKEGKKVFYIDLEIPRLMEILNSGPDQFINFLREEGAARGIKDKVHVLIDEIQYLDNPSSFLKIIADHHKYIKLTV